MSEEIKAKIVIEADTSGADEAAAALEKLQGAASSFGEGGIGDAISQMSDGFAEGAKGAEEFASAVEGIEEPLKSGEEAVSSFSDAVEEHTQALGDHQAAIESVGTAYEELPVPVARAQESMGALNESFVQSGKSIGETLASYQAFTEQFNNSSAFTPETLWNANDAAAMSESVAAVNTSFAEVGPTAADADRAVAEFFGKTNDAAKETGGFFDSLFGEGSLFGKVGEGVGGFLGGIGDAVGGLMMGLNEVAMPLFAAQMIGSMAQSAGQWLYNTNLAAEGAGASNPASFTSQVDQLGQRAQQSTNQFAVGFGAGLNPSINAWNNQANKDGGGSDFWGDTGKFLGGAVGGAGDIFQVIGGALLAGLSFGNAGMMQTGTNWENSGMQGLVNMYDAANGLPLQFPGTPPYAGATPYQGMMLSNWRAQPGGMTPAQQDVAADWQYFQGLPSGTPTGAVQTPYGTAYGGSPYTLTGPHAYTQPEGFSGAMQDIGGFFGGLGQDWNTMIQGAKDWTNQIFGTHPQTNAGPYLGYTGGGGGPAAGVGDTRGLNSLLSSVTQPDQSGFQLPHIDMGAIASNLGSQFSGIQLPHLDLGGMSSMLGGAFSGVQLPHLDLGGIASSLGGSFSGIQLPHLDLGGIASSLGGAFSGIQLPHLDLGNIGASLAGAFSGITLPPMPNIGSMIQGALGGMFSGFSLPPIPNIGSMIQGALGGMFSGFSLPPIPDVGSMIQGALGGMFSGISLPNIPDIGSMINGAIGGIFASVHMPSIPDFGAMINGAISGIFSSIHMPAIPGFASGVEGFSGGMAMVGEAGPELVMLPSGSSVYPMTSGAPIGGNTGPLSLGGGGSGAPIHVHNHISINGQQLVDIIGPDIASAIRTSMGGRGGF